MTLDLITKRSNLFLICMYKAKTLYRDQLKKLRLGLKWAVSSGLIPVHWLSSNTLIRSALHVTSNTSVPTVFELNTVNPLYNVGVGPQ